MISKLIQFVVVFWVLFTAIGVGAIVTHNAWAVWHQEQTVTSYVRDLAHREPMLVFLTGLAIGIIVSHIFWYKA